jgi:hypothetical protein
VTRLLSDYKVCSIYVKLTVVRNSFPGLVSKPHKTGHHRVPVQIHAKRHNLFNLSFALNIIRTYLLIQWSRVLLEKLTGSQLVKKFPAFYGTQMFITAFTSARQLPLSRARAIQSMPPTHFLKTHLTNILPSMPASSKWSLSHRFPHQNPVYTSPLPHACYTSHPSHSSRLITRKMLSEECRSLSSSL